MPAPGPPFFLAPRGGAFALYSTYDPAASADPGWCVRARYR